MMSTILHDMFKSMDDVGIAKCDVNKNGNEYFPASLVDGHISHMGEKIFSLM